MGERKKAVEHVVASHKHGLAAASRKIMHTMGRRTWGKYPVFSSNIYYIKMEKKSDRQTGGNGRKMGKKI